MGRQATLRRQAKQSQARKQSQENQNGRNSRNTRKPNQKFPFGTVIAIVVVIIAVVGVVVGARFLSSQSAVANGNQANAPVNGIACDAQEQTLQHIHAHVTIYINGSQTTVPPNIGIATDGSCYYWLHTHQIQGDSGVIHIEAPNTNTFTLGNFADVWGQRFSQLNYPIELNQTSGWQAYVDGKPYTGSWRNIPLTSHAAITIAYNSPNIKPDTSFNFISGE